MKNQTSAVFVTYEMIDSALQNIERLVISVPNANIFLVDNSSPEYKKRKVYSDTIERLPSRVTYLENSENSRFTAYNIALQSIRSGRIIFRTDDDVFNESITAKIVDKHWNGFATTHHKFNCQLQIKNDHRRPIETCIFDYDFLRTFLPFENKPSADWKLLERAFEKQEPAAFNDVILHKIGHGRELSA